MATKSKKPEHGTAINFYHKCCRRRRMPEDGLCYSPVAEYKEYKYFEPRKRERREYDVACLYWLDEDGRMHRFGPTRQNVVLFIAAMNDEL